MSTRWKVEHCHFGARVQSCPLATFLFIRIFQFSTNNCDTARRNSFQNCTKTYLRNPLTSSPRNGLRWFRHTSNRRSRNLKQETHNVLFLNPQVYSYKTTKSIER